MTVELTITTKGQVTLKKSVLEHLGLKPGERVQVDLRADGRVELAPVQPPRKRDLSRVRGMLSRPGQPVLTIEEINEGIADGAVAEYLRSL
jgi:AbrB family looped-hinge helix DNA binding protein